MGHRAYSVQGRRIENGGIVGSRAKTQIPERRDPCLGPQVAGSML